MSGNTKFLKGTKECNGHVSNGAEAPPDSERNPSSNGERTGEAPRDNASSAKRRQWIETVVLGAVILVVWALLSLPLVFHVVRSQQMRDSDSETTCELYDKSACTVELETLTQCLMLDSETIMVSPRDGNLDQAENLALLLKTALLQATQDCQDAAIPFACQFLFPPCAPSGENYPPSQEQCLNVSTDICSGTWEALLASGAPLPDCNTLLPGTSTCTSTRNSSQSLTPTNVTCREDFALVNGSFCVARCDSWEQSPHGVTVAVRVVALVAASIGLLAGIIVVVISLIRWRVILTFPSVFIFYMTLAYCIVAIFVIVTFFDTPKLYCSELSVEGSLENPTPFCVLAGIVLQYFFLNVTLWWFFHVSSIFWKLQFPLHARKHASKQKYIHMVLVFAGVLIPLPGMVAILATDGYTLNTFPALLCGARDSDAQYYSVWLVINVLIGAGISMLIIMFWTVHKHEGLFHLKVDRRTSKVSTAEKKLLFVFSYYIIFAAITLVYYAVSTGDQTNFIEAVTEYFVCEARGHNPDNPCPRNYERYVYPELAATAYLLLGFIPAVNLIFVVHVEKMKGKLVKVYKRVSSSGGYSVTDVGHISQLHSNSVPMETAARIP